MNWLQPAWLWLGVLGLLILWLHLQRRSNRLREVPSLWLWRNLPQEKPQPPPRKPPPPNLLMLLQLGVLGLVSLALTQPYWGRAVSGGSHTVFIVDASLSMQATDLRPSRLAAAKQQLLSAVQGGGGRRYSVVVAQSEPYVLTARQTQRSALESALKGLQGSHTPAHWGQVAQLLPGLSLPGERLRAVLLSDGQDLSEAQNALGKALEGAPLEVRILGQPSPNLAFLNLTPVASSTKAGLWRLEGRVANYGAQEVNPEVKAVFHPPQGPEQNLGSTVVKVEARTARFFRLEVNPPGAGTVELRLPADALGADNQAFFTLQPKPYQPRVLYLGPINPSLQQALLAYGAAVFSAPQLPPDSDSYDLVVVDGLRLAQHPRTHTLWVGSAPGLAQPAPTLSNSDPSGWSPQHPLSQGLDWSEVEVGQGVALPKLAGAEVLLEAGEAPLIQARTNTYGREVVLAFKLQDSNWPQRVGFPVFIANLLAWVQPSSQVRTHCEAGWVCALDVRLLSSAWQLRGPGGGKIPLPIVFSGNTATVPEQRWLLRDLEHSFRPERAGIYTLEAGNLRQPIAVNPVSGQESNLDFKATPPSAPGRATTASLSWPLRVWLMLLALGLLGLEGWLAGQQEGFLKPANLRPNNPLAKRRRRMLGFQVLALGLAGLALLNPSLPLPNQQRAWAAVVDQPSLYVGPSQQRLQEQIQSLSQSPAPVVWLGQPPQVAKDRDTAGALSAAPAVGANLEASLHLAAALLPPSTQGRIILAADGTQTQGQFASALSRLLAQRIAVDVLPLGGLPPGEVLVEQIRTPPNVRSGDRLVLQAVVYSQVARSATLEVWRQQKRIVNQPAQLQAGRNRVEIPVQETKPGSVEYTLAVQASGDTFAQNNRAKVWLEVGPAQRVALIAPANQNTQPMQKALRLQGLEVSALSTAGLPKTVAQWDAFDTALLMNVPISQISPESQTSLEAWVQKQGGGLLILGGDNSFGPGGYYQTTLDKLSPLSSRVPREAPKVAMLFVLDKSGSMNQPAGALRRIDIIKEATKAALDLLHPESSAGAIAFDTQASLVVPLQSVQDKAGFAQKLAQVEPGGGTSIYPALELAYNTLRQSDAAGRHIVLMTDGLSTPGDFEGIVRKIAADDITLSTIAVGEGARRDLMEIIARWGGGVAHATSDWQALPSILAQEALLQSKSSIKQEAFKPVWKDQSRPWLQGLPQNLPPLRGYVQTTAKPEALVHLLAPGSDPLLASWRYGLGQVVAFTSQGSGPWSADWLASSAFPQIWGQMVRGLRPIALPLGLSASVVYQGQQALLRVEALTPEGEPHSGLWLQARLDSAQASQSFWLQESSPGHYHGRFDLSPGQSYRLEVTPQDPPLNLPPRPFTIGSTQAPKPAPIRLSGGLPYDPRYSINPSGGEVLQALALASGGQSLLENPQPPPSRWQWGLRPAWPLFLLLSLLSFLVGLVVRYRPHLRLRRSASPQSAA